MQAQATRSLSAAPLKVAGAPRGGARKRGRQGVQVVRAKYKVADTTDLRSLLEDALKTPNTTAAPKAAVPAPVPAAPLPPSPPAPLPPSPPAPVPEVQAPPAAVTAPVVPAPVPGTEVLPPPPPPPPSPAPTQGMDVVLERLQQQGLEIPSRTAAKSGEALSSAAQSAAKGLGSTTEAVSDATTAAAAAAQSAAKGLGSTVDAVSGATAAAADAAAGAVSGVTGAAADVTSAAAAAASNTASAVSSVVGGSLSDAASAASSAAAAASAAASQAAEAATAAAQQVTGALQSALGGVLSSTKGFADNAAQVADNEAAIVRQNFDSLANGITSVVDSAFSAVNAATSAANSQVSAAAEGILDQLPPEFREVATSASSAASSALHSLFGQDPAVAAATAGLFIGLPAFLAWNAIYAGYSGDLSPEAALELLQTEDALLVDIRTEAQRVQQGVPELKRGALGKGVAVPPVQLLPSVARQVRDPQRLALDILAAQVAGLARVDTSSTSVIVMDERGGRAKTVARALRAAGVGRAYVAQGGFRAWQAALPVDAKASEYDASPLALVGSVAESVVKDVSIKLSRPQNAVLAALAVGGIGFVAFNFKLALRYIGVLGIELTIAARVLSYESPQDLLNDLMGTWEALNSAAKAPQRLVGQAQRTGQSARPGNAPASASQLSATPRRE